MFLKSCSTLEDLSNYPTIENIYKYSFYHNIFFHLMFISFHFLFRRFNVALPSSAAVERLFSQGGLIYTPKRTNLTDAHFEMLLFLKLNNPAFTVW